MNIALLTSTMMNFQRALSDKEEKTQKESNIKGLKFNKIYFEELEERNDD